MTTKTKNPTKMIKVAVVRADKMLELEGALNRRAEQGYFPLLSQSVTIDGTTYLLFVLGRSDAEFSGDDIAAVSKEAFEKGFVSGAKAAGSNGSEDPETDSEALEPDEILEEADSSVGV